MVSNKGTIMAVSHSQYREDKVSFGTICYIDYDTVLLSVLLHTLGYKRFSYFADLELYNEGLKVLHDFPQHYPFEVTLSG